MAGSDPQGIDSSTMAGRKAGGCPPESRPCTSSPLLLSKDSSCCFFAFSFTVYFPFSYFRLFSFSVVVFFLFWVCVFLLMWFDLSLETLAG